MDNLLTVAFKAHHPERNHHRWYRITLGQDLLGNWTLAVEYGRVGGGSQQRQFASPSPDLLRSILRERLLRRLSAPRRIGCAYRLTAWDAAPGFDAGQWLPAEVMARFVSATESL